MVTLKVTHLTSFRAKSVGLLSQHRAVPVFFTTRFGIHTFGLKFPIDVLILDRQNCVVKMTQNLSPNKVFFWPPIHGRVLELPAGEISKLKIQTGDLIKLGLN